MDNGRSVRFAIVASVIGHAGLFASLLLAGAKPIEQIVPEPIALDVVTEDELQQIAQKPAEAKNEPPVEQVKAEPEQLKIPEFKPSLEQAETATAAPEAPAQQHQQQQASQQAQPQQSPSPAAQPSVPVQPSWLAPIQPQSASPVAAAPEQPQQQSVVEPDVTVRYGVMLGLPDGDGGGEAIKKADIAKLDIAAFRTHLRRCSKLPADVRRDQNLRVVMRIMLAPNGKLLAEPSLIEAPASAQGPLLMRAAVSALQACQPYTMLPKESYDEWKMLDLSFTPADFS